MSSYHKVSRLFWKDPKVRAWLKDGEHLTVNLALYMLTCDHKNSEGLFWLPKAYVEADLALEADQVGEQMARLLSEDFIEYDEAAEVVFLPNALRYHEPKSERQLKGAISALQRVPHTDLFLRFVAAAETHSPPLAEEIRKHFRERLAK